MKLLLVVGSIGFFTGLGQLMMRAGGRNMALGELLTPQGLLAHPLWPGGLLLSWCSGLVWACLVTRVSLPTAIPIQVGMFFVSAGLGSWLWLGEAPSIREWFGFGLILCGIALVSLRGGGS